MVCVGVCGRVQGLELQHEMRMNQQQGEMLATQQATEAKLRASEKKRKAQSQKIEQQKKKLRKMTVPCVYSRIEDLNGPGTNIHEVR